MWFTQMCCLLAVTRISSCSNILVVHPSPSYSHQIAFSDMWKQLSLRGHNVTLITTRPMNNPNLTNLTEIDVSYIINELLVDFNMSNTVQYTDIWSGFEFIWNISFKSTKHILSHTKIQELIHRPGNFDVVLVFCWYPELLTFGKIHNCPTIFFSSYYLEDYYHYRLGDPASPVSHPSMLLPFQAPLSFKERIISTIYSIWKWHNIAYNKIPERQALIDKHFNISVSLESLLKDIDLVLTSTQPVLHEIRALSPRTVTIGYDRPPVSTTPLNQDLKMFLDNAKSGFIYFSLGSNVKSKDLDKYLLQTIMEAVKEVPCTFLYKYELDNLENKPDNVKLIKWAPQYAILRHPNIKLFVTQGGFQSMEEAIYSAVPMVVIPFFVDQDYNAKLMEKKGIAKIVSRKPLIKDVLKNAIVEVLSNSSYKDNIIRLRKLSLDVPMTGLEKAIWWIEYVIRNKGAKHLRNPTADLPLYQYLLLDVISFLILTSVASIVILYLLIKLLVRRFIKPMIMKDKKDQ